jgi:hypothetical protein
MSMLLFDLSLCCLWYYGIHELDSQQHYTRVISEGDIEMLKITFTRDTALESLSLVIRNCEYENREYALQQLAPYVSTAIKRFEFM